MLKKLKKKIYPCSIETLLNKKISAMMHQYGNLITLTQLIWPNLINGYAHRNYDDMMLKSKYQIIHSHFMKFWQCPAGFIEVKDIDYAF